MTDEELRRSLLQNNNFDEDVLSSVLNKIRQQSFHYLHDIQKKTHNYTRYDFKASELKLSVVNKTGKTKYQKARKYIVNIKKNFISESHRLKFKKSEFFNKEVSMFDISSNPEIFSSAYMVFVDGRFIDCTNIVCRDDTTVLIFDTNEFGNTAGLPISYIENMISTNSDISVLFIPNCAYGVLNTNHYVIKKYENYLALTKFDIQGSLTDDSTYISFINENNLLYSSIVCDTTNTEDMLRFYAGNDVLPYDSKYIHLNVFGFRHLYDIIDLPAGEEYFQIELQKMPIPVKNIIPFRDIDGKKYFAHDVTFELKYPNIYRISNNINTLAPLQLYVLYFDDTEEIDVLGQVNELAVYFDNVPDTLSKFKDGTIPALISSYNPKEYIYSLKDYFTSQFANLPLNYKLDTLEEFLNLNPNLMIKYFKDLLSKDTYILDVSETDISGKYRLDNHTEVLDVESQETFDEPRYVFSFDDTHPLYPDYINVFIDGVLYTPDKVFTYNGYRHYYIPVSLITPTSILDVERTYPYMYSKDSNIIENLGDVLEITLNNGKYPIIANDIILLDSDNKYISRDDYKLFIAIDGIDIEVGNTSYSPIRDTFKIQLLNPDLINSPFTVYIFKINTKYEWTNESGTNFLYTIPNRVNNDLSYFRIFRNGLFLPPSLYNIHINSITNNIGISLDTNLLNTDVYTINYSPNKYREVFYSQLIDDSGIVEVTTNEKPLDMLYYEFYLNGLKLNKTHIEILSANKIRIKNVSSLKNFMVLEKNLDPLFFTSVTLSTTLEDSLLALQELQDILNAITPIVDTSEDMITEILSAEDQALIFLFAITLMSILYIDPDINQITQEMVESNDLLTLGVPFLLNPDDSDINTETYMVINPDVVLE